MAAMSALNQKRALRYALVCACVVVAGIGTLLAVAAWADVLPGQIKYKLASELERSDPRYEAVMCGPVSLSVALGRLGISTQSYDIAAKCRITSYGVALTDLEGVAAGDRSIRTSVRRISWEELKGVNGVAVLFVNGDHFVAADPREEAPKDSRTRGIRIYNWGLPGRWYRRTELESIWSGEALVITRQNTDSGRASDPCIAWDECYIDRGVLGDKALAGFQFSFRNRGSADLLIEDVKTSCGCVKHKVSKLRFAPGEAGRIEVEVAVKEGYMQQDVAVKTNDPKNPLSVLKLACAAPKVRPVSSQAIRLGDLPQGGNVRHEFVVTDQGFSGIKLRDAKFLTRDGAKLSDVLSCSIAWDVIGSDGLEVSQRTGFATSRGDYLVGLSFSAAHACPLGPFEGSVAVTVEAGDAVTTHAVHVSGMIVHDLYATPEIALITLEAVPESTGSVTIQLHSRAMREIRVVKAWSDNGDSLTVKPNDGLQAGNSKYVIAARLPKLAAGAAPFKGTVWFELDDGSTVCVPVTVFRPPHEPRS